MKQIKNDQGYALLVVLLMVVLFLGLSAVFMAGSLSNAKQETTVDTSNLAVAAAEMGVQYHSTDFQREIGVIKADIIEMTQNEIKTLVQCFNDRKTTCDTQAELTDLENQIDTKMKKEYVERVKTKVNTLLGLAHTPFSSEDPKYKITKSEFIERNESGNDITRTSPNYNDIRSLVIKLTVEGESDRATKKLNGIFTVEVPPTFLSAENKLTVETVKKTTDLVYKDIFVDTWPTTTTCDSLRNIIDAGNTPSAFECVMGSNDTVESFANLLRSKKMDPADFTVYTSDFKKNVCGSGNNCNSTGTAGVTVVVKAGADGLIGNNGNMNNLNNANLIIDGHLIVDQFQNPGAKSESQTIIIRELTVNKHMHGQGLENTNLVILGKSTITPPPSSVMNFKNKITIGDNGRVCFDMDRINKADWEQFRDEVDFKNNNTTGQIIFYTNNLAVNKFILPPYGKQSSAERTKLYVQGYDNYTNFLSSCGVNVSQTVDKITNIPVPYVNDPDFNLDVEY